MVKKYWFTADWHLNHKNVLKLSSRPFGDIEQHDEYILNKCNELVDKDDVLIFCGDLAWNQSYNNYKSIFEKINCKNIYFILGNHDSKSALIRCQKEGLITSIIENKIFNIDSDHIFVSHFPYREFIGFHNGYYHIYGHCHGNIPDYCKSTDCGVDCWEYGCVEWSELKQYIDTNCTQNVHPQDYYY